MSSKVTLFVIVGLLMLAVAGAVALPPEQGARAYDALRAEAERFYAEKSFSRAHQIYEDAAKLQLTPEQRQWVEFRLADTTLRADVASPSRDPRERDAARVALETLANVPTLALINAEANEALGDFYAFHRMHRDPSQSQRFYLRALDFWAGAENIDVARRRYLSIVWRMAGGAEGYHNIWNVPRDVLVNAVKIAVTPEDRARARYFLAQRYLAEGNGASAERAFELFEEVIRDGRGTEYYDDALFAYGTALLQWSDMAVQADRDEALPAPDYAKALALFRRLRAEFTDTTSEFHDDAEAAIEQITKVSVDVTATATFVPDSEQELALTWRNAPKIELTLYAIDLTTDVVRSARKHDWKEWLSYANKPVVRRWTHETQTAEYEPGQETLRLNPRLGPGAYMLTAGTGTEVAEEVVLVTDAHILVHSAGSRAKVFVSDVETGEPIANARVRVWTHKEKDDARTFTTDATGIADVPVANEGIAFITAAAGAARQAWHQAYIHSYSPGRNEEHWRIYAFTDRPAYRPNETVQWKIIARTRDDDRWTTPTGSVEYTITDPRGEKVANGVAKLNAYGSFWSELALTPEMALGEYTITFMNGQQHRGQAQLFRLEEYKLPEFTVSVSTPDGKQYRLGETIEATIDASYYFGGPVAGATVEAVVYQTPLVRYWWPWREYPWYYHDIHAPHAPEQVVTRETLVTDANGRAILRIDTQRDARDSSYRIEARVVDASRREVRGTGSVNVMRQRYTVMAQPEHFIHRPGESVSIRFKAMDANERPVRTTGRVEVLRRRWRERAYVDEEVMTTKLDTDAQGEATLTFTPKEIGYYLVRWTSPDGDGNRVRDRVITETTIWVTDRNTTDIGYYHAGGVDLIVDKETLRAGETASVMVVVPASGRWVLLSTSADTLLDTRVVKMNGTVQLVQFPIDERHVPAFFLTASSVFDLQIATDTARVVVPPVEHFLTVGVKADREQYEPRQQGKLTITTRDADGKPVPAEVAVAVSDEAVTAIQSDLAGDPRQFFFGETYVQPLQVSAGLHAQRYAKLREETKEEIERRERELVTKRRSDRDGQLHGYVQGGVTGGVVAQSAVAEAITVTAAAPTSAPPPPPPSPVAPPPVGAGADTAANAAANAIQVQVRSDFRSTAFWKPDVVTDANGTATIDVTFPEALTTWRATARAVTTGAAFGMGTATMRTNLPLLVRLQAPRFFVVGDRTVVSAVINNNTDQAMTVTPSLDAEGLSGATASAPLVVPARGEARADWTLAASQGGTAKLRVTARGATHGDAMERSFPVFEHGIDKLIARSGKLRGSEALVRLELPRERRGTNLTVQVAPSLAAAMLDALPFLLEFPYGNTEQTMSRFLPAAVMARTLENLGLDIKDRQAKPGQAGLPDVNAVTRAGMKRLYDMQHENGAWGWWEEGPDDPWMTAYVVWGFSIAREAGLPVNTAAVDRAAVWLTRQVVQTRELNSRAWLLHALSAWRGRVAGEAERKAFDDLYANREKLSAYSRALLALTAHRYGETERAGVLVRNLEDGAQIDRTPDQSVLLTGETAAETMATAHWGASPGRFWWRWYESPTETTAFVLQALVTIDPKHRLVEPAMNWLVKNRRGAQWSNTRDTAISLLALEDYLERSGELRGDVAYELTVNGRVIATQTVTAADVLRAPSRFSVDAAVLNDTTQEIRIRRTGGTGPIYFAAEARFFSLEDPVKAAGNELFVKREYSRVETRPTLLKGVTNHLVPLKDGDTVKSGDRIEVLVTIDVKNDYEYLLFEDLKPAGFEAVELQSGQPLSATRQNGHDTAWVYQELRDRNVAMFVDRLPQGLWTIRYTLRAEVPGTFHALPLMGRAMYVPDIRANGDEVRVTVED